MASSARQEQKAQHDAARDGDGKAATLTPEGWPFDAEGDPLVEIAFQAHELVGLPNFSNITVGPAVIRTLVSMNRPNPFTDAQKRNIVNALNEVAETIEVDVIAHQRRIALDTLPDQT